MSIVELFVKIRVRTRLIMGFGLVLAIMVVIAIIGIRNVSFIDNTLTVMTDINSVKQRYAINFRGSVHDRAIAIRDVVFSRDDEELQGFIDEIRQLELFYQDSEEPLNEIFSHKEKVSAQERRLKAEIDNIKAKTHVLIDRIIRLKEEGDNVAATDLLLNDARPAFIEWLTIINKYIDFQERANQVLTKQAREAAGGFASSMLIFTTIALLVCLVVAYLIEKSLRRSLGDEPSEVAYLLSHVAEGDLRKTIETENENSVLDSLAKMQKQLRDIVSNIVSAANELTEQSGNVSQRSTEVLALAEEQGNYTTQATASLEQMREKIYGVSELLQQTEVNSTQTVESSANGRNSITTTTEEIQRVSSAVNAAVEQIRRLEKRTQDIGGITNVISGISEQTNLLALNAAIEAARAGESGRGFAVVADEVRTLAKRTGEATAEIESMLAEVQAETTASAAAMAETLPQIEHSLELSVHATEALQEIDLQANDSLSRVRDVVKASNEQINEIVQLAERVQSVAKMADSSIESLKNNDVAVRSLMELANELKSRVGFFKVAR